MTTCHFCRRESKGRMHKDIQHHPICFKCRLNGKSTRLGINTLTLLYKKWQAQKDS